MFLSDVSFSVPSWLVSTLMSLGIGGLISKILYEEYKKKYPTKVEDANANGAVAKVFNEKFDSAKSIFDMLETRVKIMVDEKTKDFSDLMFKKEMAHLDEIKQWKTKLKETEEKLKKAEDKIEVLEERVHELENFNNKIT